MYCYSSSQSKHQKTLKLIVGNLFFKTFLEWCRGQPGTDLRKELMKEKGEKVFWASDSVKK